MPESVNTIEVLHLVDRIRAGDLGARDELLRGVGRRLEVMAKHMLRGFPSVRRWADTDDVLQNSILRLLRSLGEVDCLSKREFFGLAATQIRRELLDLARHFRTASSFAANHDSNPGSLDRVQPDLNTNGGLDLEAWTRFHEAVEALVGEERDVVGLVFYHQWTHAQVADFFEVHVRTVRRWWQSALAKLSKAVRETPTHSSSH